MPAARQRGRHAGGAGPAQVLLCRCQSRSQSGSSACSMVLGRSACSVASLVLPPAQAKHSVPAGRGAWQTPAQGTLKGAVLGPPSLPRPVHRPSILERGRSSSQALLMLQSWPYPTGVSAQFLLCLVGPGRVSSPSPVGNPAQGHWERAQVFCIDHSCLVPAGVWGELPGEG